MINIIHFLKTPLITAGIISAAIIGNVANASFIDDTKVYVGAGADYNIFGKAKLAVAKNSIDIKLKPKVGLSPVLGVRFNQNFGIEASYSFIGKINSNTVFKDNIGQEANMNIKARANNIYIDFMGYMPVMDKLELIAGIGISKLILKSSGVVFTETKTKKTAEWKPDYKNKMGWRAKLGAQYNVTENIGIRTLAAYQHVNSKLIGTKTENSDEYSGKFIKNIKSIGLSAVYTF